MAQGTPVGLDFKHPFCSFFEEVGPFLLYCIACDTGVALIQCHNRDRYNGSGGPLAYFCVCCLGSYGAAFNRMQTRTKFGVKGNYFFDWLAYFCCCGLCASVQEYREVKHHHPQPHAHSHEPKH